MKWLYIMRKSVEFELPFPYRKWRMLKHPNYQNRSDAFEPQAFRIANSSKVIYEIDLGSGKIYQILLYVSVCV